ncbi:hypothetical protein KORDIASMS9_04218 [Kordia sp. SMS9]|uniref:hypothetical protein n=1 Tax=Kordia sp. SMS9 TaxID=2282170 RepID=UPI000E0D8922|nr:hypothetical protein [Kordia sp. SMS9]AXG71960.1 hypothetical protein KORDIASMS9_04218 [Kordia sp. SMS9]
MGILVEVKANENSTTGGVGAEVGAVSLKAGDVISIFCEFNNRWKLLDQQEEFITNANGIGSHPITLPNGQTFPAGSLLGSFDNGTTFFAVGLFTQISVLEGIPNPILKLYCADIDKDNNSGSIFAHIKVQTNRLVPNGSYLRTARNVKITVTAECRKLDGTFQETSVEYTQVEAQNLKDIINIDGVLTKGL